MGAEPSLPPGPVPGGRVVVAQWTPPTGVFNPWVETSPGDDDVASLLFGTLLEWTGEPELFAAGTPRALAGSYDFSADGLQLTFRLKDGVRWHDGQAFTAADVVFTFQALMHPDYDGARRLDFTSLRGVQDLLAAYAEIDSGPADPGAAAGDDGKAARKLAAWRDWVEESGAVEAAGAATVVFRFDVVHGPVLGHIGTAPILARHQFADVPVAQWPTAPASRRPLGTGPFMLGAHTLGETTTLVRFPDYHGGAAHLDEIVFRVIDPNDAADALLRGDVDLVGAGASPLDPGRLSALAGVPGVQISTAPGFSYHFVFVNLNQPRFQDPRVRQALARAVDRQDLVDRLLAGRGRIVDGPLPPGWWEARDFEGHPFDPEGAAELLEEAGWVDADGDGVRERDLNGNGRIDTMGCGGPGYGGAPGGPCETLSVRLLIPEGDELRRDAAREIARQLDAVGFDVRVEAAAYETILQRVLLGIPRDYDLGLLAWELGADADQLAVWQCGQLYNFVDFCEDTVGPEAARAEELAEAGRATHDPARRRSIYAQWAAVLHEQLPYVFLFSPDRVTAAASRLRGVNQDFRGPLHNPEAWWIAPGEPTGAGAS